MKRSLFLLSPALAVAISLAACTPPDAQTAGQRGNQAVAGAKAGTTEAPRAGDDAATKVASVAADTMITAKINAALAADDKLQATKIDVDTSHGNVVLKGTAPDAAARERATTLAHAVEGVVAVDNQLVVAGEG